VPRPQKVSDDSVFEAVGRAMARLAPHELTLGEIAAEAGVTAGTLVQRFGSKRELLRHLIETACEGGGEMMAALRSANPSALATVRAYAECMAQMASSPDALARNLAYLQIDLTDPEFRKPLLSNARDTRAELAKLIREAVKAGELSPTTNAQRLARTVETITSGALLTWAIHREGSATEWMRREISAVLEPYLPLRPKRRKKPR